MENKTETYLMMGLLWITLAVIVVVNTWNRFGTLPAEFLLGCAASWSIACGMNHFRKTDMEND